MGEDYMASLWHVCNVDVGSGVKDTEMRVYAIAEKEAEIKGNLA